MNVASFIKKSPTVFVSYSHHDEQEKDALLRHLGILHHNGLIELWNDDRIGAGADWEKEISQAMERANVAILLISVNFLNSDFILRKEIPKLLARRQNEGLIVFPIIAKACVWRKVAWLTKMNVRPKNGKPVWSDHGGHVDDDLAAIAEEVADIVERITRDPDTQTEQVPVATESPALSSSDDGQPSTTVFIENPKLLSVPSEAEAVLKIMFADCQRVVIIREFGAGFSGSRIFLVRPIVDERTARLRTVVKLGSISLIEKEWQAYQGCIRDRLPDAAQIQGNPVFPRGSGWGGIRYSLQGSGGTFEIQSLHSYLRQADVEDINFILGRLFKRLEQILQQSSSAFEFYLQASYDRILPINYLIEPTVTSGEAPTTLSPETVFDQPLKSGDLVRVEGFIITKVDPKYKSVTLNLPGSSSPTSYQLRLKPIETIGADRLGQVMNPVEGVVIETRQDKLEAEVRRALGPTFDLVAETVSWSDSPAFPNPLTIWPIILNEVRDIKVACIHGDLNMENILVDPKTRDVSLIDFAEACQDHVLHDFLRLETEVVTKIIPEILHQHSLPAEAISAFYQQLHIAVSQPSQAATPSNRALERPWVILLSIREIAKQYLRKYNDWTEYYQGLMLYLLGALKFKNLDEMDEAPAPLPKQVAFWGAATVMGLTKGELPPLPPPSLQEQRRIDAVVPSQAEVGQQMDLFVQVRFPDSPLLGIQDWPVKQKPSSTEQVTEYVNLNYSINPQTRKPDPVRLEIRVTAPNYAIEGKARRFIEIIPEEYSKIISFLLTPLKTGNNRINIEVYNTDGIHLGVIPVETTVGGPTTVPSAIVANLLLVVKVIKYATSEPSSNSHYETQIVEPKLSLTQQVEMGVKPLLPADLLNLLQNKDWLPNDLKMLTEVSDTGERAIQFHELHPYHFGKIRELTSFSWEMGLDEGATYEVKLQDLGTKEILFQTTTNACQFNYPADAPQLKPGNLYQWSLKGKRDDKRDRDLAFFEILASSELNSLVKAEQSVGKLTSSEPQLALGALYKSRELYGEAVRLLQELISTCDDSSTILLARCILAEVYEAVYLGLKRLRQFKKADLFLQEAKYQYSLTYKALAETSE